MSLLVTAVVIYGVGGPLFPKKYYRHLSQEQRDKGFYENIAPHIPSRHALTVIQLSFPSNRKLFSEFFFVITFGWLGAVYSVRIEDIILKPAQFDLINFVFFAIIFRT